MKHEESKSHEIQLESEDVAYIKLPRAASKKVARNISLREIINDYKGSEIFLDFSEDGVLVGIEILA